MDTPPAAAEARLRAALDSGDPDTIAEAVAAIGPDDVAPPAPLGSAALWYAEQGLRVFPLQPGTKIPLKGGHGCLDATSDPEQIRAWWARVPDANIGIATGHLVDVVDIDGPKGQKSRGEFWEDIFAQVDADSVGKVLTPSPGGMHVFVPATGDGNGTNIAPSVDYRGVGGYVVAPPSVTDVGTYRWLGAPRFEVLGAAA